MGIRFKCHHCQAALNIKDELRNKRGVCPNCQRKFRIPSQSQDFSIPLEELGSGQEVGQPKAEPGSLRPVPATTSLPTQPTASARILQPTTISASGVQATISQPTKPPLPQRQAGLATSKAKPPEDPPRPAMALPSAASPQASDEAWYIVRPPSGGEYGPASHATVEAWISQRRITADTQVCKVGTTEWKNAKEVFLRRFLFPS